VGKLEESVFVQGVWDGVIALGGVVLDDDQPAARL
jgi:hypothetical protein